MTLFNNKYRIESARLKTWDYGSDAPYFITICTKGKEHFFGEIEKEEMILNDAGKIVEEEWLSTQSMRADMNIELEIFTVMPNHFHAIISIGQNEFNSFRPLDYKNEFGIQSKNLASIIRGFKSAVTRKIREEIEYFAWQGRYHDHIIRNHKEYLQIRNYISDNPKNWQQDKFYR